MKLTTDAHARAIKMEDDCEMRAEYDFSNSVPSSYAVRFAKDFSVNVLDSDGNPLEKESREAEEEIARMLREAKFK